MARGLLHCSIMTRLPIAIALALATFGCKNDSDTDELISDEVLADASVDAGCTATAPVNFNIAIEVNEGDPVKQGSDFRLGYSTTPYPITGTVRDNGPFQPEAYIDVGSLTITDLTTNEVVYSRDFGDRASTSGRGPCWDFSISVQRIGLAITADPAKYIVGREYEARRVVIANVRHFDAQGEVASTEVIGNGVGTARFRVAAP